MSFMVSMAKPEYVVLVDESDQSLGVSEKLQAHRAGLLHRAVSVLVFDGRGRLLLQKRAAGKYHSGGLWSNTACTHPQPGETTAEAAHRSLREEMGFDCELTETRSFTYRARMNNDFIEHEYDHVFTGRYDRDPRPDVEEIEAWRWDDLQAIRDDMTQRPDIYTAWFKIIMETIAPSFGP